MLKAENLVKKFNEFTVINDISLAVKEGEFLGIIGESGSGKSTLLYLLSGLLKPTSGSVLFDDFSLNSANDSSLSKFRANNFGFIFQEHNLIDGLSVRDNILLSVIIGDKKIKDSEKIIDDLLKKVGLDGYKEKNVSTLSGGQRQRVAIARALINSPKILFADEPTGSLDSENAQKVIDLFGKINRENAITVIMVTHSEKMLCHCSRVINIRDGKITNDSKGQ